MSNNPRFLSLEIPGRGSRVQLDPEQSAHCAKVLRLQVGAPLSLINGRGLLAEARILEAHSKKTWVEIIDLKHEPIQSAIHLVFGITKPIALESILKKCTELGIASFQPLVTDHSLHPGSWNADRWNKVIVEACKQSQELWFPALAEPLTFSNWLSQRNALHSLIVCDENERTPSLTHPLKTPVEILIGPEGGWSVLERERLKSLNGISLGLGKNRLRADTACLVALALTKNAVGEL